MDFKQYVKGISFRQVHPMSPKWHLEAYNTRLPEPMNTQLANLCALPKMSTYAIAAVINKAVKNMPSDQCYLNIGVWHGFTLFAGMINNSDKYCIGVDNFSEFGGPRNEFKVRFLTCKSDKHSFYDMDYKKYFADFHEDIKIGVYIYDGSHDYKNQMDGLLLAEAYLADNAIIMIDDINWPDPERATLDFIEKSKFNYEIVLHEKTSDNGHQTWWNGFMIIQKKGLKV